MLNHRIRDLLFHYKKGVILLQFYLIRVFKKIIMLISFRARVNDVNSTFKKPAKCPLFFWIDEVMGDTRRQSKFSGFA